MNNICGQQKSLRQKAFFMLAVFLILMLVFTVVSRAADSVTVPRVDVVQPCSKVIEHKVTGEGKVMENLEKPISTVPNITVETIYAAPGKHVKEGEVLFQLDMENIEEEIKRLSDEIQKLELNNKDISSRKKVEEQKRNTDARRADEDLSEAAEQGRRRLAQAEEALGLARQKLDEFYQRQQAGGQVDSSALDTLRKLCQEKGRESDEKKAKVEALSREIEQKISDEIRKLTEENGSVTQVQKQEIRNRVEQEYAVQTDAAKTEAEAAEAAMEEAQIALESLEQQNQQFRQQNDDAQEEQLLADIELKEQAYEEAAAAKEEAVRAAKRALQDAKAPAGSDSTDKINELELENKRKDLEELAALKEQKGQVISPVDGVVTELKASTGDKSTGTSLLTLADLSSGSRFVARIDKDQEKYIARNDAVRLTLSGSNKNIDDLVVESITPNAEDKDLLDVTVMLPADLLEIGTSATMSCVKESKPQNTCIPIEALHMDNGKYFVLLIEEKKTVLGTELIVRRKDVIVADKNGSYAALDEGSLLPNNQVITESDRSVEAGSRVRLREQ